MRYATGDSARLLMGTIINVMVGHGIDDGFEPWRMRHDAGGWHTNSRDVSNGQGL